MDVTYGAETPAGRDEAVVWLHAGQLADPADRHGGGGGGVGHAARPAGGGVAVVQLSLNNLESGVISI